MRLSHFIVLAFFLASKPILAGDAMDTFHLAASFCSFVQNGKIGSTVEKLATPALAEAIDRAMARNAAIQAGAPDEKPPLGDGIPWTSWPDRPNGCTIDAITVSGERASLPISYGFADASIAPFTDTLVLQRTPGGRRIDDVMFVDGQSLTMVLQTAFDP